MNRPRLLRASLLLVALLPLLALADAPPVATIRSLSGGTPVKVVDLGRETVAAEGMALHDGFRLETGADTRLTLLFNDGNVRFVGRNAKMSWSAAKAAPAPASENAVAVLGQILTDGAPDVFRNVVTGAAMASRPKPSMSAGKPMKEAPEDALGGAGVAAQAAPAPAPAPPSMAPGAPLPDREAAKRFEPMPEAREKIAPAQEVATESTALESAAADLAEAKLDDSAKDGALRRDPAPQRSAARKRQPEPSPETAAWRAGRGFTPQDGEGLSLVLGRFVAPFLPDATEYALQIFADDNPDKPIHAERAKRPEFTAKRIAKLKAGGVYLARFSARTKGGETVTAPPLRFAVFPSDTEEKLAEKVRVIQALPRSVDPPTKALLLARVYRSHGLFHLARREAERAVKTGAPGVRESAEALLQSLGDR